MILSNIKRIRREDIPDAPAWVDRIISPFNIFVDSVYNAFSGKIELNTNVQAFYKELEVSSFPVTYLNELPVQPKCIILAQVYKVDNPSATIGTAMNVEWDIVTEGIRIKNIAGLTAGVKYKVRLLAM